MVTYGQIGIAATVFIAIGLVIYIAHSSKLSGFWNDADGLSITDIIAVSIVGSYILFLIPFAYKLVKGSLTVNDISLLGQTMIPVTTVLGGYFIDRTAKNFSSQKRSPAKEADIDARV